MGDILRACIYVRISDDKEGAGLGVARQREDCEKLAVRLGYGVAEVFTDNDKSAYSGKPRPAYREMMSRLVEFDVILAWHPDRLHRSPAELESFIDALNAHDVTVATCTAGDSLNLDTPSGRLIARQLGSLARYESEHKAERIRRKMQELVLAGKWTGGTRPFGWDVVDGALTLNEHEAALVREAFERVLSGRSLGSIVVWLNELGVKTTADKPWGYAQVRQMLLRPRNAGFAMREGAVVAELEAAAIVSEGQFRAVEAMLGDPSRRRSRSNRARWLLSGIAKCHCGEVVRKVNVMGRRGEKLATYRCVAKGAGHVAKRAVAVDVMVTHAAVELIHEARTRGEASPELEDRRRELENAIRAVHAREDQFIRGAAEGLVEPGQMLRLSAAFSAERQRLEQELVEVETELSHATVSGGGALTALLRSGEYWTSMTIDQRRDWVRHNLRIVLLPHGRSAGRRFDPSTVEITSWKGDPVVTEYVTDEVNELDWAIEDDRKRALEVALAGKEVVTS
jgi:DNA invertase Pin-like site-specific DNA recombinase